MRTLRRLGVATAAMLLMAGAAARADYAYAYSVQDVKMRVSGVNAAVTGVGSVIVKGATGAAISSEDGTIDLSASKSGVNDPAQSFVSTAGVPNKPPENSYYVGGGLPTIPTGTFAPKGQVDPSYARGDDQVSATGIFGDGFRATNVAETYLTAASLGFKPTTSTGNGSWSIQSDFRVGGPTALQFSFDYKNLLLSSILGAGASADASYHVDISIVDTTTGFTIYHAQPDVLNHSVSVPNNGSNSNDYGPFGGTGLSFSTLPIFVASDQYHLTISGVEVVNAGVVPEPGSIALLAIGGAGALGLIRRRKAKANA